jgi:lipoyl(octanoyl) transferase
MTREPLLGMASTTADLALQVYLLGLVDFEAALLVQKRLAYHLAGDASGAALILCEHFPLITIGRQGSRSHVLCEPEELRARQWRIRWVNRGGGCLLHLPGQLAIYPILPLDRLGLGVQAYLDGLHDVLVAVLDDFGIRGETRPGRAGVWVGSRLIADVGVAVRQWVSYFGVVFNVNPDLEPFRRVRSGGTGEVPMTSLTRERRSPLRTALVRERLLEHFAIRFQLTPSGLFFDHPLLRDYLQRGADTLRPRGLTSF